MAKSRPTQSVLKGVVQEGFVLAKRKKGIQNVNLDVVFQGKEVPDVTRTAQDFIIQNNLPLSVVSYYCQVARKGQAPSMDKWVSSAINKVPPGDKYFALLVADSDDKIIDRHLFKIRNGVPVEENLAAITESEFHKLALSIREIDVEETYNVTTIKDNSPQQMPTISQDILQPVRDTEVPIRNKIQSVENQFDTEIPTSRKPQSQSGFSPEEIAAAELNIPPELSPSNTSQLFREDLQEKKSSDTLMPVEEDTRYSSDRTERDAPSLSPSNTTVHFKNDTPVPTKSDLLDDDLPLSDEDFELDEDSEAIVDLEGELGNTRFLERTPTGKLVKPDGEKLLDASAPSLKPVSKSPDTEIVPALKPREPSMQEEIKAHFDSLESKEDGYFGQPDDDFNDLNSIPRSLTKEVQVPAPLNGNLRKEDIPFKSDESNKVLGKKDIAKDPISMDDDFLDGAFSPPSEDVGEDTELNIPPVSGSGLGSGSKTERLPTVNDAYVLMDSKDVPQVPVVPGKFDKPGIPVPKSKIERAIEDHKNEESKVHKNKIEHVQKVIQAGKDAGLAFVYRDYPGIGEIGFFIPEEFADKLPDTRFTAPSEFLEILDKAKITSDDFALTQVYAAGGSTYDAALKFSPGSISEQIFSQWAHLYFLKVHNNPNLSEEQKKNFVNITGISAFLEGAKSVKLSKSLEKSEKKAESLQKEVSKYHALGSYNELVMLAGGKRPSKIKRYAAAVLALAAGVGGYFLNGNQSPANNSDLEGKLAQVTTERDSANSKYEQLSKEYKILVSSEKDLKSQLDSVKKEKDSLEEKMKFAVSKEEFDSLSKQYESLETKEKEIREQLEKSNKEKLSLEQRLADERKKSENLLELQKLEYESNIDELNEKYSSYVSRETLDEILKQNENYKDQVSKLTKELESLKDEVEKYESLGNFDDVKSLVEKNKNQKRVAGNSEQVYKIFLGQLEKYSVTNDDLERHIACANLTKAAIRSGEEAQVWLAFMRLVDQWSGKDFGSSKEHSSLVIAKLMEAAASGGNFDNASVDNVVLIYKRFRDERTGDDRHHNRNDDRYYNRKCMEAAERVVQHFLSKQS